MACKGERRSESVEFSRVQASKSNGQARETHRLGCCTLCAALVLCEVGTGCSPVRQRRHTALISPSHPPHRARGTVHSRPCSPHASLPRSTCSARGSLRPGRAGWMPGGRISGTPTHLGCAGLQSDRKPPAAVSLFHTTRSTKPRRKSPVFHLGQRPPRQRLCLLGRVRLENQRRAGMGDGFDMTDPGRGKCVTLCGAHSEDPNEQEHWTGTDFIGGVAILVLTYHNPPLEASRAFPSNRPTGESFTAGSLVPSFTDGWLESHGVRSSSPCGEFVRPLPWAALGPVGDGLLKRDNVSNVLQSGGRSNSAGRPWPDNNALLRPEYQAVKQEVDRKDEEEEGPYLSVGGSGGRVALGVVHDGPIGSHDAFHRPPLIAQSTRPSPVASERVPHCLLELGDLAFYSVRFREGRTLHRPWTQMSLVSGPQGVPSVTLSLS
ncbi:hypothetical protein JZ751_017864 [Albula glossodonta]|uniref:Uncharacterized protein n=1 Tax=Albula glossodonta TaxID=121402 RepID=A0A8T2PPN1_9TELE|nr:hypothetical protein JZ751_017864 [Albula glossodonta]